MSAYKAHGEHGNCSTVPASFTKATGTSNQYWEVLIYKGSSKVLWFRRLGYLLGLKPTCIGSCNYHPLSWHIRCHSQGRLGEPSCASSASPGWYNIIFLWIETEFLFHRYRKFHDFYWHCLWCPFSNNRLSHSFESLARLARVQAQRSRDSSEMGLAISSASKPATAVDGVLAAVGIKLYKFAQANGGPLLQLLRRFFSNFHVFSYFFLNNFPVNLIEKCGEIYGN